MSCFPSASRAFDVTRQAAGVLPRYPSGTGGSLHGGSAAYAAGILAGSLGSSALPHSVSTGALPDPEYGCAFPVRNKPILCPHLTSLQSVKAVYPTHHRKVSHLGMETPTATFTAAPVVRRARLHLRHRACRGAGRLMSMPGSPTKSNSRGSDEAGLAPGTRRWLSGNSCNFTAVVFLSRLAALRCLNLPLLAGY